MYPHYHAAEHAAKYLHNHYTPSSIELRGNIVNTLRIALRYHTALNKTSGYRSSLSDRYNYDGFLSRLLFLTSNSQSSSRILFNHSVQTGFKLILIRTIITNNKTTFVSIYMHACYNENSIKEHDRYIMWENISWSGTYLSYSKTTCSTWSWPRTELTKPLYCRLFAQYDGIVIWNWNPLMYMY